MKSQAVVIVALLLLSLTSPVKADLSARVVGLRVIDQTFPSDAFEYSPFTGEAGTQLKLLVSSSDKSIVEVLRDESSISSMKADDHQDLLRKSDETSDSQAGVSFLNSAISPFLTLSKDRSQAVVEVNAPAVPAKQSGHIAMEGQLAIRVAKKEETIRLENVALESGPLDLNGFDVAITEAAKKVDWDGVERLTIDLTFRGESADAIKSVRFLGPAGHEVDIEGGSTMTFPTGKVMTFPLADDIGRATIVLEFWRGVETIVLPLDVTQTIGL